MQIHTCDRVVMLYVCLKKDQSKLSSLLQLCESGDDLKKKDYNNTKDDISRNIRPFYANEL